MIKLKHFILLIASSFSFISFAQTTSEICFPKKTDIYKKGWIDFNKNGKKDVYENPTAPIDKRLDDLISQMTLQEKANQLCTYYGFSAILKDVLPTEKWKDNILQYGIANIDGHMASGSNRSIKENETPGNTAQTLTEVQRFFVEYTRLGIPVDLTNEGIRGLCARGATSFPSMNGLGCTWNRELAALEGMVVGREARLLGYTNIYAPILDVVRDQRWGRWDGTISEDPYLVSELGTAMAKAMQEQRIVSTPKHFVGYGDCKGARQGEARVDPHITPSEMYYIHEYPFRKVFKQAGALGVMSAYCDYDGDAIAGSYHYLTEVLRKEMGFKGYVVSDSYSIEHMATKHHVAADKKEACLAALKAGLNVRTHFDEPAGYINNIVDLVNEGRLPESRLDELVRDVLYVKFWIGLFDQPYTADAKKADKVVSSAEHLDIALRASRESLVLMKNDGILPLGGKYKKIAVVGPNAKSTHYIPTHYGPNDYKAYMSVYDGIKEAYKSHPEIAVNYAKGINHTSKGWPENELIDDGLDSDEQKMVTEAVKLAENSDVVVLVVGDGDSTSGEDRTRTGLDLPGHQEDLLRALVKTGKPVVMVLVWGRPATINYAQKHCPAILGAAYPGAQGGRAIGEAIKGDYNPGGKLTGTWVKTVGQLPFNVPCKPNSNWENMGKKTVGNKGLLYCFGHGLSYTTFEYSKLEIDSVHTYSGRVTVSVDITNTGSVAGDEVLQLYLNDVLSSTTTYEKKLCGFERIHLKPGETKTVRMVIDPNDLVLINKQKQRVIEPGEFRVMVGSSYEDIRLASSFFYGNTAIKSSVRNSRNENVKIMDDNNWNK